MRKITKQDRRDLRKLAEMLPPTFADGRVERACLGHQLLAKDPNYKLPSGEKIDPNGVYTMEIADRVLVNDYRRLKKILATKGIQAVKEYVDSVNELNSKKQKMGGLELMNE